MALADRRYDRPPQLIEAERAALGELSGSRTRWPPDAGRDGRSVDRTDRRRARRGDTARRVVGALPRPPSAAGRDGRPHRRVLGVGPATDGCGCCARATRRSASSCWRSLTWCAGQRDLHLELRGFKARKFAGRVFGTAPVDAAIGRVQAHWMGWGIGRVLGRPMLTHALMDVMLLAGSPLLEDLAARGGLFVWLRSREHEQRAPPRRGAARAHAGRDGRARASRRSGRSRRGRSGLRAARPARSTCPRCGLSGRGGGLRPRPCRARAGRTPITG